MDSLPEVAFDHKAYHQGDEQTVCFGWRKSDQKRRKLQIFGAINVIIISNYFKCCKLDTLSCLKWWWSESTLFDTFLLHLLDVLLYDKTNCPNFLPQLPFEPRQANLCLRAFRHDKFQLRMPSHSEGPGIWFSVWKFLLIHCLYEQAAKVLARLRGCAGSPEPSLLA